MKTQDQILTKLEVMQEMKHNLAMKEDKNEFERFYIINLQAKIEELMWILDMNTETLSDEEIKAKNAQDDIMQGYADDMREEPENDSEDTMDL